MSSEMEKLRDKVFIAVDFDGGFRIEEPLNIRPGDVNIDENENERHMREVDETPKVW
jgi:integrase